MLLRARYLRPPARISLVRPNLAQPRFYAAACDASTTLTAQAIETKIRSQIEVKDIIVEDAKGLSDGSRIS